MLSGNILWPDVLVSVVLEMEQTTVETSKLISVFYPVQQQHVDSMFYFPDLGSDYWLNLVSCCVFAFTDRSLHTCLASNTWCVCRSAEPASELDDRLQ